MITCAVVQLQPLVGNEAPDFLAEAVYDQEFQTVSLSQYRVRLSKRHTRSIVDAPFSRSPFVQACEMARIVLPNSAVLFCVCTT